ncbi:methyltransferase domain-containing protein [Bradyrhizobium sp. USDA 4502]
MNRAQFVSSIARPALEIGPFHNPQIVGEGVSYFEVLNRDQLIARASGLNQDTSRTPHIDFVSPTGDLSIVDRHFESALSSHCIEHQPDLVRHLQHVERILKPGGRYFLIIPDKRYCFDHFLPESSIADILDAYATERHVHTFGSIMEHWTQIAHNEPARHWRADHGEMVPLTKARFEAVFAAWKDAKGGYIDVHAWQFTPRSFRKNIEILRTIGLTSFVVESIHETERNSTEFFAILRSCVRQSASCF